MAEQVLPFTGLDQAGLIEDVPPVALPPVAFSDCRNVRFRDGAVQKMEGDVNILPYINMASSDVLRYVAWWPNPNLAFASLGYYLVILEQTNDGGFLNDNAYLVKVNEAGRYSDPIAEDKRLVLTPAAENFKGSFRPGGHWQHTFFQGGFSLIINNGIEAPRFILDSEDNTETVDVPVFVALPNWASYAEDPLYLELLAMENDETVANLQVTAGVIRDFGDFLVAGDLVERGDILAADGTVMQSNTIIRSLPGIVRSSDIAEAGRIPANWNPFATAVNTADEFTITNDGIVQDFVELQGNMFIYSNSSISVMARTGNAAVPLSVRPVTTAYGTLTTDAVIEYDGRHFVVGAQDIYIFGGHPGSIQSVADGRVRDSFYNRLNPLSIDNTFILRYQQKDEIWICYANKDSTGGLVNEALIWNYRKNNWTKRDLQNVVSGDIGPIPGGGLPLAELIFSGSSGNNEELTAGAAHVNSLASDQEILAESNGIVHKYNITIASDFPVVNEVTIGTPIHFITFGQEFDTGGGEGFVPLNFVTQGRTFVEADNQGRFLQVPNYDSDGVATGDHRDFNFRVPLSANVSSTASTQTEPFATAVTLQIFLDLLRNDPANFTWPRVQEALDPDDTSLPQYIHDFFIAANDEQALPEFDENAPITLHLTNQFDTFVIQYEVIPDEVLPYTSFVSFGVQTEFFDESSLIRTATEVEDDQIGHLIEEEAETAKVVGQDSFGTDITGPANVFYFDFDDVIDDGSLDDLVFFFKGAADSSTDTGYAELPTDAVVFRPDDFTTNGDTTLSDGGFASGVDEDGDADPGTGMDGGAVTDTTQSDGERATELTFDNNLIQDEPIAGSEIASRLEMGGEFAFQVWVPDGTTVPTEMTLVAYQKPLTNDGEADATTSESAQRNFVVDDIDPALLAAVPPIVEFSSIQQEFNCVHGNLNNSGWVRGDELDPEYSIGQWDFSVALAYDSGDTVPDPITDAYRDAQRSAFAEAIFNAFFNNNDLTLRSLTNEANDDGSHTITLESNRRIAVHLEGEITQGATNTIGNVPVTIGSSGNESIVITQTQQGKYDYEVGAEVVDDLRPLVLPRIRVQYTDPEIRFFDFDTEFDIEPGTNEVWLTQVANSIRNAKVRDQWVVAFDSGAVSLTTTSVIYDEALGDTGVEVPDARPDSSPPDYSYVAFPAEREGAAFVLEFCEGSGWADEINTDVVIPTQSTVEGSYPTNNTPSYITLRVSDTSITDGPSPGEEVLLFPISADQDAGAVVVELQGLLNRRAPRLRAVISGDGRLSVQPANYNDLANYVVEFQINNPDSITRVRELLDPNQFNQDEFNPKPVGDLPFRVQTGRDTNTNEVDNNRGFIEVANSLLEIDNSIAPTDEFDVLRPWPKTQVNFTLEFPIFAATRLFEDGATTNKVLAADIGFARPIFLRPEVRRVEVVDGSQSLIPNRLGDAQLNTGADLDVTEEARQASGDFEFGQDAPENYISFIERKQQGLSPEFTTETLNSVAMWTDGRTQARFRDTTFLYNYLELKVTPSDNPGHNVDLSGDTTLQNTQFISEDYKVDTRITGRFVNWRISDGVESASLPNEPNKTFSHQADWRLSGLQFSVGPAGRR